MAILVLCTVGALTLMVARSGARAASARTTTALYYETQTGPTSFAIDELDLSGHRSRRQVVARWPVAPGGKPVGMAIDPAHHRLFIGCRGPQKLIVMNTQDGKVEAALPLGSGNDAVRFSDGQAFASCRDGSLTIAAEKAGQWQVEQVLHTAEGARTLGIDTVTHRLFLPTAQFEPATTGRPKMKPGTFAVVVVDGR